MTAASEPFRALAKRCRDRANLCLRYGPASEAKALRKEAVILEARARRIEAREPAESEEDHGPDCPCTDCGRDAFDREFDGRVAAEIGA